MPRILIADDEARFRRALRLVLETSGYEIREAADGPAALQAARGDAPDLILLDWRMPALGGSGLCRQMRAVSSAPIIVVSSAGDIRRAAISAGADDFVAKPFSFPDLLDRIKKFIRFSL